MVVEFLLSRFYDVMAFFDGLFPTISWPSWITYPADLLDSWASSATVNLDAVAVWVHPVVFDIVGVMVLIQTSMFALKRIRRALSYVTGGGGVVSN